jgi:hypothetical protein
MCLIRASNVTFTMWDVLYVLTSCSTLRLFVVCCKDPHAVSNGPQCFRINFADKVDNCTILRQQLLQIYTP